MLGVLTSPKGGKSFSILAEGGTLCVIPVKTGIQAALSGVLGTVVFASERGWIPASAGMTENQPAFQFHWTFAGQLLCS
jgi:hypothetical protein